MGAYMLGESPCTRINKYVVYVRAFVIHRTGEDDRQRTNRRRLVVASVDP